MNLHRRQLTRRLKAFVHAQLRQYYKEQAKERKQRTEGRPPKLPANMQEVSGSPDDKPKQAHEGEWTFDATAPYEEWAQMFGTDSESVSKRGGGILP